MSKMRELEELCQLICEEQATQADVDKLAELLRNDDEAQARYLEMVDLHHSLRWMRRGEAVAGAVTTLRDAGVSPLRRRSWRRVAVWSLAAAAALVLAWLGRPRPADPVAEEAIVSVPPEKVETQVVAAPITKLAESEIVARVVSGADVFWVAMRTDGKAVGAGQVEVYEGRLELALASGGTVVVDEHSVIGIKAGELQVHTGCVIVDLAKKEKLRVVTDGGSAQLANSAVGLKIDGKGERRSWCALRGDAKLAFDRRFTGRPEVVRLTRDESVVLITGGGLLENVMGDAKVFRTLLDGDQSGVQLANAGFEYPPAKGVEAVAAAGWRFQVLPLMNATEMPRDDAVGLMAPKARGSMPMPPEGRQWAFLAAERLKDGRYFHSATYQELGPFVRGATYEMQATIAAAGKGGAPLPFAIGLYGGDPDSQPRVALSTLTGELLRGEHKTVHLRFRSPNTNVYFDQHLFVRAELGPPTKAEKTKLLIDKIEVRIVDGGKQ